MSISYFLYIPQIPGSSQNPLHPRTIEITNFSWGTNQIGKFVQNPATQRVVKLPEAQPQNVSFGTGQTIASPLLFAQVGAGSRLPQATVYGLSPGDTQDFMILVFTDVLFTSMTAGSNGGDLPTEIYSMEYLTSTYTYVPKNEKGEFLAPVTRRFDSTNQSVG